jgi:hypothetical protein
MCLVSVALAARCQDRTGVEEARRKGKRPDQPARKFADLRYRTRNGWSCEHRVIGKAESTQNEANPRFIVTNVGPVNGAAPSPLTRALCPLQLMSVTTV